MLVAAGIAFALSVVRATSKGNPECWMASLTYENCCLPEPQAWCWDRFFTPEKCCRIDAPDRNGVGALTLLRDELFTNVNPYSILNTYCGRYPPQMVYPDSHLTPELVGIVLRHVGEPALWLEVGSFLGNSAITTARSLQAAGLSTGIVCIDPFTGVANQWATRKAFKIYAAGPNSENSLLMDEFGYPRIYETFLANVRHAGFEHVVMPLRMSSISGMRLLAMLRANGRLPELPKVIYLDSAHEEGETMLEVRDAWRLLPEGGLLFGDDWSWPGVEADVTSFTRSLNRSRLADEAVRSFDTTSARAEQPIPGLILVREHDGTWMLPKFPTAPG